MATLPGADSAYDPTTGDRIRTTSSLLRDSAQWSNLLTQFAPMPQFEQTDILDYNYTATFRKLF
jgi:hypothetical protein